MRFSIRIERAIKNLETLKRPITVSTVISFTKLKSVDNDQIDEIERLIELHKSYRRNTSNPAPVKSPAISSPTRLEKVYNIPGYSNVVTVRYWEDSQHTYECVIHTLEFLKKSFEDDIKDIEQTTIKEIYEKNINRCSEQKDPQ